jgi:hypothetical protein
MADTPKPGETVNPEAPSNTPVQTPAPAPGNASDPAEVERLKKEAEQATLRANQLANQLKAREEKEAEDERKRLEEQQEYKTLAEQAQAKLDAMEAEKRTEAEKRETAEAKAEIFKGYSEAAIELANDAGVDLTDTSDEAQAKLRSTLDKLQAKVADKPVTPNNGANTAPNPVNRDELLQQYATDNRESTFDAALQTIPGIQAMKASNGDA